MAAEAFSLEQRGYLRAEKVVGTQFGSGETGAAQQMQNKQAADGMRGHDEFPKSRTSDGEPEHCVA
jgi:hypothetical protein